MVSKDQSDDVGTDVESSRASKLRPNAGARVVRDAESPGKSAAERRSTSRRRSIPAVIADVGERLGQASAELMELRKAVALSGSRRKLETQRLRELALAIRNFERFVVNYRISAEPRIAGSRDVSFQVPASKAFHAGFYLGSADAVVAMRLTKAIQSVALDMGYIGLEARQVESGSVWVTFSTRWKAFWADPRTTTTTKDLANEVVQYAQATTVEKAVAEVSLITAKAISELMASLKDEDYAAVDLQNVLLLKYVENGQKKVIAHTMTSKERAALQKNPELRAHPGQILSRLADLTIETGPNPDTA